MPILDDPFTPFMLPVNLLDNVAMGIPVITSSTPTIRAYFSDDMVTFPRPGDPEAFAAGMVNLYDDSDARTSQVAASARFTDADNWPQERSRYYDLIDSMIEP